MPLKTKAFRSKKKFAYENLRENILNGDLQPGSRLIIDGLAQEFGISPIPVREALQCLQSEGFVTIKPFQGAKVDEIRADLIQEIFELLKMLAVISGRAACQKMTKADFETLEALIQKMDNEVNDLGTWVQGNAQVHQYICEWADMALTQLLLTRVLDQWAWLGQHCLKENLIDYIRCIQADHWALLAALRSRNPDIVTEVVTNHNEKVLTSYLAHLEDPA